MYFPNDNSTEKEGNMSSLTNCHSCHRKSGILFIGLLSLSLLLTSGCALMLFEYPLDRQELAYVKEKTADPKISELADSLSRRPDFRLTENKDKSGATRLIFRDLQDFIDNEWLEGRDYLKTMPLTPFASDISGTDGLLVPRNKLARYEIKEEIASSRRATPGVKFSFVHLSDVQLRDERVYMFNKRLTRFGDYISDGFEHEPNLVFYDYSYYLTQIGIIRMFKDLLPPEGRPQFMIHTGDAPHMGVVSELYEFIYMTNKLNIPWYNTLGNHDYQVFGNLNSKHVGVIQPHMGFQTVSTRYNYINMHGKGFAIDKRVYFSPDNAPDDNTSLIGSVYNGFDRQGRSFAGGGRLRERRSKPCQKCPGYYHFEAKKPRGNDPGILIVVLDTSTRNFKFAKGTVYRHNEVDPPDESRKREQIEWLEGVLEEYADRANWMVLAFGHHALNAASFSDKSWKKVAELFTNPKYNVVAYFCGHSHKHRIYPPENEDYTGTFGFWQIMTDSIMEYPKRGSLVNIAYTEKGSWEITIQSFWPYFLDNLPDNAPVLLRNARKCYEASKVDKAGKKKLARYRDLKPKHHDVVLRFPYPKAK